MIIGTGVDIVDIRRIDRLFQKFGDHFLNKIFTKSEIAFSKTRKEFVSTLAKIFALKEATVKAISNTNGLKWHDMEVSHDDSGRPLVTLSGQAFSNVSQKSGKCSNFRIHASLSDEKDYAIAFVLIEC